MPGVGNNYFVLKNVKIPCAPSFWSAVSVPKQKALPPGYIPRGILFVDLCCDVLFDAVFGCHSMLILLQ